MKVFGATLVATLCFSNVGKAQEEVGIPFDAEDEINIEEENLVADSH